VQKSDALRTAIVGAGGIAKQRHVEALADLKSRGLESMVVTAVCDTNEENARAVAAVVEEQLGAKPTIHLDYHELLGKVDAVDLCLPHGLHHGPSIEFMEAGAHVLCEKPLGITIAASRAMAEAADRTGKVLATAVPYRRLPGQRSVRWLLNESGLIGRPLSFFHQHTRPPRPRPAVQGTVPPALAWRLDRQMSGGGMVMDSGFHYCDSIRYFLGPVERIYAEARSMASGTPQALGEAREDTVFVTFVFKSGVVGTWCWQMSAVGEDLHSIVFYGSQGSVRDTTPGGASIFHLFWRNPPNLMEAGVVTKGDGATLSLEEVERLHVESLSEEQREWLYPRGCTNGFAIEMHDFAEAVFGRRPKAEVDGWDGLASLAICEGVYESALSGQPVSVDDVAAGKVRAYQKMVDERWGL
jgi:predicted dehydrogenase